MAATVYRPKFRPFVQTSQLLDIAEEIFGLEIIDRSSVKELESYDDRNFLIESKINAVDNSQTEFFFNGCRSPLRKFVLKVLHSKNTYDNEFLEATVKVLDHLKAQKATSRQIRFPENVRGLNGEVLHLKEFKVPLDYLAAKDSKLHELIKKKEAEGDDVWRVETDEDGDICIKIKHYIRLLTFIPGKPLVNCKATDSLLFEVGALSGIISQELKSLSYPPLLAKDDIWDLKNLLHLRSAKYLDSVQDEKRRALLQIGLDLFEKNFLPIADSLPQQIIHSDLNEGNIIVSETNGSLYVSGLVDFGDITHSYHVFEVSIAMAYMALLRPDDCINAAGITLSGFLSVSSLSNQEKGVLFHCLVSRIVQSLIIGSYSIALDPGNQYLSNSSINGFRVLETFLNYKDNVHEIYNIWQA